MRQPCVHADQPSTHQPAACVPQPGIETQHGLAWPGMWLITLDQNRLAKTYRTHQYPSSLCDGSCAGAQDMQWVDTLDFFWDSLPDGDKVRDLRANQQLGIRAFSCAGFYASTAEL